MPVEIVGPIVGPLLSFFLNTVIGSRLSNAGVPASGAVTDEVVKPKKVVNDVNGSEKGKRVRFVSDEQRSNIEVPSYSSSSSSRKPFAPASSSSDVSSLHSSETTYRLPSSRYSSSWRKPFSLASSKSDISSLRSLETTNRLPSLRYSTGTSDASSSRNSFYSSSSIHSSTRERSSAQQPSSLSSTDSRYLSRTITRSDRPSLHYSTQKDSTPSSSNTSSQNDYTN